MREATTKKYNDEYNDMKNIENKRIFFCEYVKNSSQHKSNNVYKRHPTHTHL